MKKKKGKGREKGGGEWCQVRNGKRKKRGKTVVFTMRRQFPEGERCHTYKKKEMKGSLKGGRGGRKWG